MDCTWELATGFLRYRLWVRALFSSLCRRNLINSGLQSSGNQGLSHVNALQVEIRLAGGTTDTEMDIGPLSAGPSNHMRMEEDNLVSDQPQDLEHEEVPEGNEVISPGDRKRKRSDAEDRRRVSRRVRDKIEHEQQQKATDETDLKDLVDPSLPAGYSIGLKNQSTAAPHMSQLVPDLESFLSLFCSKILSPSTALEQLRKAKRYVTARAIRHSRSDLCCVQCGKKAA